MLEVKYPEIEVQLTGTDGNAFAILGKVKRAIHDAERTGKAEPGSSVEFMEEAQSGDYDHLLQTCMKWVNVS
jgi:hypothetical protein